MKPGSAGLCSQEGKCVEPGSAALCSQEGKCVEPGQPGLHLACTPAGTWHTVYLAESLVFDIPGQARYHTDRSGMKTSNTTGVNSGKISGSDSKTFS